MDVPRDDDVKIAARLFSGIQALSDNIQTGKKRKRGSSSKHNPVHSESEPFKLGLQDLALATGHAASKLRSSGLGGARLEAPLPQSAQSRLDRLHAYEKTKDKLDAWTNVVKEKRQAEHVHFAAGVHHSPGPLIRQNIIGGISKQVEGMEGRVASILSGSGIDTDVSQRNVESENTKAVNSGDKWAATSQLRLERELLLRQERKAKRLKRIKSKSYRRILKRSRVKDAAGPVLEEGIEEFETAGTELESHDTLVCLGRGSNITNNMLNPAYLANRNGTIGNSREDLPISNEAENRTLNLSHAPVRGERQAEAQKGSQRSAGRSLTDSEETLDGRSSLTSLPTPSKDLKPESNPWLIASHVPTVDVSEISDGDLGKTGRSRSKSDLLLEEDDKFGLSFHKTPIPSCIAESPTLCPLGGHPIHLTTSKNGDHLLRRAFASDNIVKQQEMTLEDACHIRGKHKDGLTGWGQWASAATGRRRTVLSHVRTHLKTPTVTPSSQISRKTSKYLASALPFPFESRQQYERSLRHPIGQEWGTTETHQSLVKPRIITRTGRVILPLKSRIREDGETLGP